MDARVGMNMPLLTSASNAENDTIGKTQNE